MQLVFNITARPLPKLVTQPNDQHIVAIPEERIHPLGSRLLRKDEKPDCGVTILPCRFKFGACFRHGVALVFLSLYHEAFPCGCALRAKFHDQITDLAAPNRPSGVPSSRSNIITSLSLPRNEIGNDIFKIPAMHCRTACLLALCLHSFKRGVHVGLKQLDFGFMAFEDRDQFSLEARQRGLIALQRRDQQNEVP